MRTGSLRYCCALAMVLAAECNPASGPEVRPPFYSQKKNGCGAASVAMVMHYWETQAPGHLWTRPTPEEVYEALYRPEQKGIRLADMKLYLEASGFRVFTLRGQWADVEEHVAKGRPLIVSLKKGRTKPTHFVVVTSVGGAFVSVNDPTRKKPSRLGRSEFEKQWALSDRWMLLATPPGPQ